MMVTFDVLVVATVARLLAQVLTLLGKIFYLESLHTAMAPWLGTCSLVTKGLMEIQFSLLITHSGGASYTWGSRLRA